MEKNEKQKANVKVSCSSNYERLYSQQTLIASPYCHELIEPINLATSQVVSYLCERNPYLLEDKSPEGPSGYWTLLTFLLKQMDRIEKWHNEGHPLIYPQVQA